MNKEDLKQKILEYGIIHYFIEFDQYLEDRGWDSRGMFMIGHRWEKGGNSILLYNGGVMLNDEKITWNTLFESDIL